MTKSLFQFRLRTFFFVAVAIAVMLAIGTRDVYLGYFLLTVLVTAIAFCISRFSFGQARGFAAASGIFSGVLWTAVTTGAWLGYTLGAVSGCLGFCVGGAFGILLSVPTVLIIAMIPTPRIEESKEPISQLEDSKPFMEPYQDTQGY